MIIIMPIGWVCNRKINQCDFSYNGRSLRPCNTSHNQDSGQRKKNPKQFLGKVHIWVIPIQYFCRNADKAADYAYV